MALPLATPSDLEHWDLEGYEVEQTLKKQFPTFEPRDTFWHFLADADIRVRDAAYREYQHRLVSDYVTRLRYSRGIA